MLSSVEHEKCSLTSEPVVIAKSKPRNLPLLCANELRNLIGLEPQGWAGHT